MEISQDSKDLKIFFNIGKVYNETRGITKFRVTQKDEILNKYLILLIIHFKVVKLYNLQFVFFFTESECAQRTTIRPLQGVEYPQNFRSFCKKTGAAKI
jgi:hypothetical protein